MASLHSLLLILQSLTLCDFAYGIVLTATSASEEIFHTQGARSTTPLLQTSQIPSQNASLSSKASRCAGDATSYCPACDGVIVQQSRSRPFMAQCNMVYTDVTYYEDVQNATVGQCINACMKLEAYYGPVISPDGRCFLAQSETGNLQIIRESGWALLLPAQRSRRPGPFMPPLHTGQPFYLNSSAASSTSYVTPTASSGKGGDACQASSISCPDCDGAYIEDAFGKTYHVFCDNRLYSDSTYAVQRWLTPTGCMAECDNFTWCGGSTYWPEGNCQLARGEDVFPQERRGYTAFLPVNVSHTTPPPELSAYPTGTFTSARQSSTTSSSGSCDPSEIRCPQCDALTLHDGFNESCRVQCNFEPICNDITGRYGRTSQNSCIEH